MRGLHRGNNSFLHLTHQRLSKPWGQANRSISSVRHWTPMRHPTETVPVLWRRGSSPSDLPSPSSTPSGEYHSDQHVINNPRFHDAVLIHANQSFPVKILFDSGSSGNFLSSRLLSVFNIPRQRSPTCYQITTIQGESLGNGLVWCKTPELTLRIGCLHEETLTLLVLEESAIDVVLRRPWMAEHQPTIRWSSGDIEKWSTYCLQHCLRSLPVPPQRTAILGSTTVESLEIASRVDLLPGTKLPKGSLPIVDPGAQGHGGVHQGSIATGVHLTIHLSDGFQFILRGQEGCWAPTTYRLS